MLPNMWLNCNVWHQWSDDPMDVYYGEDTSSWAYASQRVAIEQDVVMWHATSFAHTRSPPPAYGVLVDEDEDREYGYEYRQPQFGNALDALPLCAPSPPPHDATREPEDARVVHVLIPAFRGMRVSDAHSDAPCTPKTKRRDVARTKAQDAMRLKIAKQRGAHAHPRPRPSSPPTPSHPTPRPARRTKGAWARPSTPATPSPTYTYSRPTSSLHTPSPPSSISSDLQTPPAAARERVPTIVVPGGRSVAWAATQLGHMSLIPAEKDGESDDEELGAVAWTSTSKWKGECRMVSPPDAGSDRTDSEDEGDRKPVILRVSKEQRRKAMEEACAEREEKEARRKARAERRATVMAARKAESAREQLESVLNATEGLDRPPHRKHRRAEREGLMMMPYRRGETATRLENMKKRIALELQVR